MATNLSRPEREIVVTTASSLVLASASPRRAEILRMLGFEFDVVPADIDEESLHGLEPNQLAIALAEQKALIVSALRTGSCLIGADTVVEFDGVSLGKPSSPGDAIVMLQKLSGRNHEVHTGIAVRVNDRTFSVTETSEVTMRELGMREIEQYVESGAAMDKAGAYGIQDSGLSPVESHSGSYLNIVGLPVRSLAKLLLEANEIDEETSSVISTRDAL